MGVMDQKFGSAGSDTVTHDFRPALRTIISVIGRYRPRVSRGWMGYSSVGTEYRLFARHAVLPVTSFSQHPTCSLICILAVIVFSVVVLSLLPRPQP